MAYYGACAPVHFIFWVGRPARVQVPSFQEGMVLDEPANPLSPTDAAR